MENQILQNINSLQVGPSAIIAALTREINLVQIINNQVIWDEKQCNNSPGLYVEAMIINILTDRKPLYRVSEFFKDMDVEALFGPTVQATDFNDDALGNTLDRLAESNLDHLYSNIVLQAHLKHRFRVDLAHGDTTSITVYGDYANASSETLNIVRGFNKDGHRDCKQIVAGAVVTPEGIPLMGTINDGNLNDVKWNQQIIEQLPEMLKSLNSPETIYVADSKLVTIDNLKHLAKKNIRFISRIPETFGIVPSLKDWAFRQDKWQEIENISPDKNAAVYKLQSIKVKLGDRRYRFIIVHSSNLDQKKEKTLKRTAENEQKKLEKICKEIGKQEFACEKDAISYLRHMKKKQDGQFYHLDAEVIAEEKKGVGHPKTKEKSPIKIVYRIKAIVSVMNETAWQMAKERASTFVLITNLKNPRENTAETILRHYKEQNTVEMRFRFLKNPAILGQVFLKKPSRVKALGYIFLITMLIYALMERRVRQNLAAEGKVLQLSYRSKVKQPTGMLILQEMTNFTIIHITHKLGKKERYLPTKTSKQQLEIIRLTGFDESIYLKELSIVS
jgi:transposase